MAVHKQSVDGNTLPAWIRDIVRDQQVIWSSPFHSTPRDIAKWLTFTFATGVLIALDDKIESRLPRGEEIQISKVASQAGTVYALVPTVAVLVVAGRVARNLEVEDVGWRGITALVDTEIIAQVLKVATQRPRPDRPRGGRFWRGGNSFPSAHSIKAWALAAIASKRFEDKRIGAAVSVAAVIISVARVLGRRHFASDALAGAGMGWFIGGYVVRRPGLGPAATPRA